MFSSLPWWCYGLIYLLFAHITIISVTIYLHRHQTHRSIGEIHYALSHFLRFWGYITHGMITKEWVAVHRKHHAKVETVEDPHSPYIFGLAKVFWLGYFLYHKEAKNPKTLVQYGAETPEDWIERNIYAPHSSLGLFFMLGCCVLFFGLPGIGIWILQMLTLPALGAGFINGVGHAWGYRNYDTPDQSRNIIPLGIFTGGEELHNNHHRFQRSAKFSVRFWEFDIGWLYIWIFQKLSLVKNVHIRMGSSVDVVRT